MKITVLGGGGFIGSHMIDGLLSETSHDILAYDLYDEKIEDHLGHTRLDFIRGDIREDHERVEELIQHSDLVVDLIAHANPSLYVESPLDVVRLNFDENLRVAQWCIAHQKRLIQFSTCEVYGKTVVPVAGQHLVDPENPLHATFEEDVTHMVLGPVEKHRWIYSCAKQLLERIIHAYGLEDALDYTIIRPFNFIGPRIDYLPSEQDGNPRVFSHFVQALKDGSQMPLVDGGEQRRCYTLIDDAVDCILRIVENSNGSCSKQIFNIGSPQNEVSIRQLALKMIETYRRRWWDGRRRMPELVEVSGDEFYGQGYDDSDRRIPSISKAESLLGWKPKHDIDSVIEKSMAFWFERDHPKPTLCDDLPDSMLAERAEG